MYLLDTNILSERRKNRRADPGVIRFVDDPANELFLPVQVLGELLGGIEQLRRRGDLVQAKAFQEWYELVKSQFSDRILVFDATCAEVWGRLMAGNDQNAIDKQMAAIALAYGLTVVTRNTSHFEGTGVPVFNPFTADAKLGLHAN